MESRFKEWVYIEGLMQSAYHESALKMNLSDSEFWILYVFNFHQEGCNQSVLYKEACLTKSTVNSAIRKMEQKGTPLPYPRRRPQYTWSFLTEKGRKTDGRHRLQSHRDRKHDLRYAGHLRNRNCL